MALERMMMWKTEAPAHIYGLWSLGLNPQNTRALTE